DGVGTFWFRPSDATQTGGGNSAGGGVQEFPFPSSTGLIARDLAFVADRQRARVWVSHRRGRLWRDRGERSAKRGRYRLQLVRFGCHRRMNDRIARLAVFGEPAFGGGGEGGGADRGSTRPGQVAEVAAVVQLLECAIRQAGDDASAEIARFCS